MRQYIDAYTIANTVRMSRSQHRGAFVIVEGSSDVRVYKRFVDSTTCQLVPALGKANATGALGMLEKEGGDGVLAIVDSDFWLLDGVTPDSANLLTTDTHDLETMILSSPALDKVLDEFCEPKSRGCQGRSVSDILLEIGRPLGFFRWLSSSKQENMSLRFKHLHFQKFITIRDGRAGVDIRGLVREVRLNTGNFMYDEREIAARLTGLVRANHHDPWHVCRGHDLVAILSYLLREVMGNRRAKTVTPDVLDSLLRLSYEYRFFRMTKLYGGIRGWETAHEGYRVLPAAE